jgi:putative addiction module component (TIGR02574 family)
MTRSALKKSIDRLPVTERIELMDELMVSIARDHKEIPVTTSQKRMIDKALDEIEKNPGRGIPLAEFRKMLKQPTVGAKNGKKYKGG